MQAQDGDLNTAPASLSDGFSLFAATALQDDLLMVATDLERLQGLVDDTSEALSTHFHGVRVQLQQVLATTPINSDPIHAAMQTLSQAIAYLQFQDMATQLIAHTTQRLRHCTDRLACGALGDDDSEIGLIAEPPMRPNPVTQDKMGVGADELF